MNDSIPKITGELGLTLAKEGRYRIMLFFLGEFSASKENRGLISLFLSGAPYTTNMDLKVYECPNPQCSGVLEPKDYHRELPAVCPRCHRVFRQTELVGEMVYDATVDKWSKHLARYVRALGGDCDINLMRLTSGHNMIAAEAASRGDVRKGGKLDLSRQKEEALYTMKRMIDDTSKGKSLESAIRGFLLA